MLPALLTESQIFVPTDLLVSTSSLISAPPPAIHWKPVYSPSTFPAFFLFIWLPPRVCG